jgi:hypothetical protein
MQPIKVAQGHILYNTPLKEKTFHISVAGICRNQAFPEMPGVSPIAKAIPEFPELPCLGISRNARFLQMPVT